MIHSFPGKISHEVYGGKKTTILPCVDYFQFHTTPSTIDIRHMGILLNDDLIIKNTKKCAGKSFPIESG